MTTVLQFTPQVQYTAPSTDCTEIGNVTRITASAWTRTRVFQGNLIRGEQRCLVVDYNGALSAGRTIVAAKAQCGQPYICLMSNLVIQANKRAIAITVQANYPNDTMFKFSATLDNGEVYVQTCRFEVDDTYWFDGDTVAVTGPTVLYAP